MIVKRIYPVKIVLMKKVVLKIVMIKKLRKGNIIQNKNQEVGVF